MEDLTSHIINTIEKRYKNNLHVDINEVKTFVNNTFSEFKPYIEDISMKVGRRTIYILLHINTKLIEIYINP